MDATGGATAQEAVPIEAPAGSLPPGVGPRTLLLVGAVLVVASGNRWSIPELAWVASAPWLAYAALYRSRRDRSWLIATVFLAITVSTAKVISPPIPYAMAFMFSPPAAIAALVALLVFSFSVRRLGWFPAVLVLASLSATVDWLTFTWSPLGTWSMPVNTQLDNLPLLQSLALGGPALLSWLFALTNGVAALAVAAPSDTSRRGPVVGAALLVVACYAYGFVRLDRTQPGPVVRTAAVRTQVGPSPDGVLDPATVSSNQEDLFSRSALAADRGANLVVWNEAATIVPPSDEDALVERGRAFARERRVELVMAYAVLLSSTPRQFDNQYRWFAADGSEIERYRKHHPVPGEGSRIFASWNQLDDWLRALSGLRHTAQQLCAVVRRNPAAGASRNPATQ